MSEVEAKAKVKTEPGFKNNAVHNKAIEGYFMQILTGFAASDRTSKQPEVLVKKAMELAKAAYKHRCDTLGQTLAKNYYEQS